MFSIFESVAKAAVNVVTAPVAVVADVITLGGSLSDQDKPYTAQVASDLVKNLKDAGTPGKK